MSILADDASVVSTDDSWPRQLYQLTLDVAAAQRPPEVFEAALTCLHDTLGVEKSSVLLLDNAGVMRFAAWHNLSDTSRAAVEGHSPWNANTTDAAPVLVEDVRNDPSLAALRSTIEQEQIRGLAFIPLAIGPKLLGKFMLYYDVAHVFTNDEVLVAQTIAAHVALAIDQQAHRESEHRCGELLKGLGVAVYTTDKSGRITFYNEEATTLWGRTPDEGDAWCGSWRLYRSDGSALPHEDCPMGVALAEDRAVRGAEAIVERPDGTRRWLQPFPTPLHDDDANLIGAVNVLVDITERKQAEKSAAYLNAIITSSEDAIVSKDLTGTVTSWNQGAERLFGFDADEMIGRSIRTIIPSDRQSEEDEVLGRVRRGERVEHFETIRIRKDGTTVPISLTVSPVRDSEDRIIGCSKIARDISQRKHQELAIAEALAVKDEFIGLVSHELRTPLTAILGNAAILASRERALDEESRLAAAADVHQGALRLSGIVDDLLALTRLEAGQIDREPTALARLIERSVKAYRQTSDRRLELRIEDKGPVVLGDARVIGHVLTNYLSNAEKYTPPDSTIEVVVDCSDGAGRVRVLDRGIGVSAEESERLFESFYRGQNVGHVGGMGIGLSVCQRLIRSIGGTCWAAPRQEGGSEFGFAVPLYEDSEID